MTIDDVRKELDRISRLSQDDIEAHKAEDTLWHEVLKNVADGAKNSKELAKEALKSDDIAFRRGFS